MKLFSLRNTSNGKMLATRVNRASDPWTRGVGLLPRAKVAPEEGLWIAHCNAVHTIGMRATIDLFFLDKDNRVLRIANAVPPGKLAVSCRHAATVVELGAASEAGREVLVGDRLALE
jgi:uncharacterized membrane protein (UPF0127 family)